MMVDDRIQTLHVSADLVLGKCYNRDSDNTAGRSSTHGLVESRNGLHDVCCEGVALHTERFKAATHTRMPLLFGSSYTVCSSAKP